MDTICENLRFHDCFCMYVTTFFKFMPPFTEDGLLSLHQCSCAANLCLRVEYAMTLYHVWRKMSLILSCSCTSSLRYLFQAQKLQENGAVSSGNLHNGSLSVNLREIKPLSWNFQLLRRNTLTDMTSIKCLIRKSASRLDMFLEQLVVWMNP